MEVAETAVPVRGPLTGHTGAFVVVELWRGDQPGGVLARVGAAVLGDVVRFRPVDGAAPPLDVLVRHARILTRGIPPLVAVPRDLAAPELVALLATARAGSSSALSFAERVFCAGARFLVTPATSSEPVFLEELAISQPDRGRHEG